MSSPERYKPVEHAETAAEALAVSLNETGDIHWPRMTELTGHTPGQMQRELGTLVYRNPEGSTPGYKASADEVNDLLSAIALSRAVLPILLRLLSSIAARKSLPLLATIP